MFRTHEIQDPFNNYDAHVYVFECLYQVFKQNDVYGKHELFETTI